jgi:predicted nucleotidyltransferase
MKQRDIEPLREPLAAAQRLLEHFDQRGVIIGGVAVTALGAPRFTADVDVVLLLSVSRLGDLIQVAGELGLTPRIENAEQFARRNRVLLLRHASSGIAVDISLGMLPFEEEVVARSDVREVAGLQLRLPTIEDLIILKAVAHRPKDLADIAALAQGSGALDRKRIERWVREFGEALEMPQLWQEVAGLLG